MNFFRGMALGGVMSDKSTAMNDTIGRCEIDTCFCFDTNKWETGIKKDECEYWVIVEKYDTENLEELRTAHLGWCEKVRQNPQMELIEVGIDEWIND